MLSTENIQNELSRTVKMLIDSGEAKSIEEAYEMLGNYRLTIRVGADVADSPTLQAALLTMVNTARRCFLGGVEVVSCPEADLLVHLNGCRTLKQSIVNLQGNLVHKPTTDLPEIVIGDGDVSTTSEFAIRATFEGWVAGVAPVNDGVRLAEKSEFTPAGVLAGSLAVSEAFQFVRGRNPSAGRLPVGLSLWEPHSEEDWTTTRATGPELELLPSRLWLIGLGHLGQAYLWTLGFLPYASPDEVMVVLQDTDRLTNANDSTSPLTRENLVGQLKTRVMAQWCEARGFRTRIVERLFADDFRVAGDEPLVALCGVDNALARAAVEDVGFTRVIEAGLGRGTEEYLAFQIHHFPGSKRASNIWDASSADLTPVSSADIAAYRDLGERGMDQCGITMLANRSVGASFVGTFTSTLVIAELLRMSLGGPTYDVIDGTLRRPASFEGVPKAEKHLAFNPGITPAEPFFSDLETQVDDMKEASVEI